jgi:hypothetical protein
LHIAGVDVWRDRHHVTRSFAKTATATFADAFRKARELPPSACPAKRHDPKR